MNSTSTLATQLRKSIDKSLVRLAQAVDEQRSSDELRRYFDIMARFPMYSWRNAWLISMQRPLGVARCGLQPLETTGKEDPKGREGNPHHLSLSDQKDN